MMMIVIIIIIIIIFCTRCSREPVKIKVVLMLKSASVRNNSLTISIMFIWFLMWVCATLLISSL